MPQHRQNRQRQMWGQRDAFWQSLYVLMIRVIKAFCGSGITLATMPPVAEATIVATTGRSHAAVIISSFDSCFDMLQRLSALVLV